MRWTGQLAMPGANFPGVVLDVEIDYAVGVGPVEIDDDALECYLRFRIESGISVVGFRKACDD